MFKIGQDSLKLFVLSVLYTLCLQFYSIYIHIIILVEIAHPSQFLPAKP